MAEINSNYPEVELFDKEIPYQVLKHISKEAAEKYKMVVFEEDDKVLKAAMVDPEDVEALNALRFIAGQAGLKTEIYKTSLESFKEVLTGYDQPDVLIDKAVQDYTKRELEVAEKKEKEKEVKNKKGFKMNEIGQAPVEKIVDVVIDHAILGGASDIHIEPQEKNLRVRYRVDGDLFESFNTSKSIAPAIVSRVKIMADLKIDEKRKPQDGRIRVNYKGEDIDLRISTLPTSEGEKVVMRILRKEEGLHKFDDLGLFGRAKDVMLKAIEEPYGVILVTGPTGSGKSTTIFTSLRKINKIDRNIVTLEDPVEYKVPGVNHSQVRPEIGFSFASGLRSILRQDPDIIMVGEIRDSETAELATHAALTGHLVLSTLHTNDALGAIPRLVDMGIEPFLVSSSLTITVAQRLIRRLCKHCKEQVEPSQRVKEYVLESLEKIPEEEKQARIPDFDPNNFKVWQAKGCAKCKDVGTKGRIAIYEVVECTPELKKIIDDSLHAAALNQEFIRQGAIKMREDGVLKALNGHVSIEAVNEATIEDEDTMDLDNKDKQTKPQPENNGSAEEGAVQVNIAQTGEPTAI